MLRTRCVVAFPVCCCVFLLRYCVFPCVVLQLVAKFGGRGDKTSKGEYKIQARRQENNAGMIVSVTVCIDVNIINNNASMKVSLLAIMYLFISNNCVVCCHCVCCIILENKDISFLACLIFNYNIFAL